ncbi:MAG: hypothetical protein AAF918_07770 [Pseudomonadota bacterium]
MKALTLPLILLAAAGSALAEPPNYRYTPITQQPPVQSGHRVVPNGHAEYTTYGGPGDVGYEVEYDLEGNDWFHRPVETEALQNHSVEPNAGFDGGLVTGSDCGLRDRPNNAQQDRLTSIQEDECGL